MEISEQKRLLDMLKAVADESRLALLGLLNEREHTVGDLAARVQLTEPTVSHHLARLRVAGLVTLRMAGNQRFYRLNEIGLVKFKHLVADIERLPSSVESSEADEEWIAALGWDVADQQVLREHTLNQRLIHFPGKQKKLIVILRWLATLFQPGRFYTEPEVNTILKAVYAEDFVVLRRELVDFGYLRRERGGGKYWLTPADDSS